ncbi:MAG: cyclopropane-fatty-acyl-phospholipid synthase family protein [Novosphingobium sp.]
MNAQTPVRGAHLVAGGERTPAGTGWFARLVAGRFHRLLDRIDAGLACGTMDARLPDGSVRRLGGRGDGPWAQIDLTDWNALLRLATGGSVGWYQAWEAREWDSSDPVQIFALFMRNAGHLGGVARAKGPWRWLLRHFHWLHRNSRDGAQKNIAAHYDLGNDFYAQWLGPTMLYSGGLFDPDPPPCAAGQMFDDLDKAQSAKCTAIIERLALDRDSEVLEIGCGWGTLAAHMADAFGCRVTAISLSDEQLAFARAHCDPQGGGRVDFVRQDYRDVGGRFDAIVSIEMVEAVGQRYWPEFFDALARALKPGGRAVIQYIAIRDDLFDSYAASADFIQTYVFPGGMLVRESAFKALAAERGLEWRDPLAFGLDYAETLRLWRENFDRAVDEGRLPPGFDQRFVRLWRYYLMYCEGGFRGGGIDVVQVTLVKG